MSNGLFAQRGPTRQVTVASWVLAHEAVLEVAQERARLERREGTTLLCAFRERVHRHLGYGAFAEYTDRHLGYCHRTTADKLRTAEALEQLPELARAQNEGRLNGSAVRELARVATAETESAWIEAARGRRVREIERMVSGRARGDSPTSAPRPELEKHVLRFEVSAETLAAFRETMRRINEQSGEKLDDDSALLLMARAALSASTVDGDAASLGRANYQVAVFECQHCKRAFQPAGADTVEIDASTPRATQSVPPAIRRQVLLRDHKRCQVPGCRNTLGLDVHHIQPRSEGGTHGASNLLGLCSVHHRAVHEGELHVSGLAPDQLVFQHADGTPYGGPVSAPRADVCKKVFDGLCWLGFKSNEARRALDECTRDGDVSLDAKTLLRKALERLR
jgi:hypothetical protein